MASLTAASRDWLAQHHQAVLITLRADGSAQSSNVLTAFDGDVFRVSVTAGRAKTRNLARDPRAVVHVLGGNFWGYASVTCSARLGTVSTAARATRRARTCCGSSTTSASNRTRTPRSSSTSRWPSSGCCSA